MTNIRYAGNSNCVVGFSHFEDRLLLNDHPSGREKRTQHEWSVGGTYTRIWGTAGKRKEISGSNPSSLIQKMQEKVPYESENFSEIWTNLKVHSIESNVSQITNLWGRSLRVFSEFSCICLCHCLCLCVRLLVVQVISYKKYIVLSKRIYKWRVMEYKSQKWRTI